MAQTGKFYRLLLAHFSLSTVVAGTAVRPHAQIVGGTIGGTVQDSTGAAVAGATVTVRQTETGATRTLVDRRGRAASPRRRCRSATTPFRSRTMAFRPQQQDRHLADRRAEPAAELRARRGTVQQEVVVDAERREREHDHAANLGTDRRAPGEGTAAERAQLRRTADAESGHRELHQRALRRHRAPRTPRSATCSPSADAARRTICFC